MQNASDVSGGSLVKCLERMEALLAEAITLARTGPSEGRTKPSRPLAGAVAQVDFSSNIRAFVKRYVGGMSGPQKFVLLLAYLTKGDSSKRLSLEEIQRHWNKMTAKGLFGVKFNRFYSATARERDWVNTEKSGHYHLRPSWREIFHAAR